MRGVAVVLAASAAAGCRAIELDKDVTQLKAKAMLPELGIAMALMVVSHAFARIPASTLENMWLDAMLTRFACSLMQLAALFVVGFAVSQAMELEGSEHLLTTMLTSGSVVIGLASQDVLSNFAAGIVLIFTRPFEVGDNINVAGTNGIVKSLSFFNTRIVTSNNEGVNIPNKCVVGGAMRNNSDNYNQPATPSLREVNIDLYLNARSDLERAIAALEKAGKQLDAYVGQHNASSLKTKYDNGTHTLAEFHETRYRTNIHVETKATPTAVFVGGQGANSGHHLQLRGFCDQMIYWPVFQTGYRIAVKELTAAGIQLYDNTLKHA